MDVSKRKRLESAGWRIGDTTEFLDLTPADVMWIELHELLVSAVIGARRTAGLTQSALAERLGSSQSRVAKMEAGDPGISVDFLLRTLFALGYGVADIGRVLATRKRTGTNARVARVAHRARSHRASRGGSEA